MKKSIVLIAGTAFAAPLTLAGCGNDTDNAEGENEQAENVQEDTEVENNEEESESEIEDLAAEYDLDVSTEEGTGEAPEATREELEEAFQLISTAVNVERLDFIESPQEGELEESGEAEGHYGVHESNGETREPVLMIRFDYEMEEDFEDENRHPSFSEITYGETEFTGSELIEWEESHFEVQSTGDRTVAEFFAEGDWLLHAEYEGIEISMEESGDWFADFATSVLVGVEE